jgi:transketolase
VRSAFFDVLVELAEDDPRIELVVGDIGFGVVDIFARKFPGRFLNVGVAEQNMTGVATGMALTGSVVFTYSIGNFPTLRCLEQVRSDVCYHNANVKIVAVGGGLAYGALGISHHATEDLAILRALPGIVVAAPGDPLEADEITRRLVALQGPAYLRLGKTGEPTVHAERPLIPIGSSIRLAEGADVAILVTGGLLPTAIGACERLAGLGISVRVVSMPWISPLDSDAVRAAGRELQLVVTLEEHSIVGGLGGAVAEVLAEEVSVAPLLRIGLPPRFTPTVGSQEYLRSLHGLDPSTVTRRIADHLRSLPRGPQWREAQAGRT